MTNPIKLHKRIALLVADLLIGDQAVGPSDDLPPLPPVNSPQDELTDGPLELTPQRIAITEADGKSYVISLNTPMWDPSGFWRLDDRTVSVFTPAGVR